MDAKAFLKQPEKLDILINNKLIEKKQWRDVALSITGNTEGERVQTSGVKSKMASAIDRCIDLEAQINSLIDKFIDTKMEVIATIEQVESPIEYNILHLRYIQYVDLQGIADYYGKEYGWATTTHGRAIKSVQDILDRRGADKNECPSSI